jgi:hypothetical protein
MFLLNTALDLKNIKKLKCLYSEAYFLYNYRYIASFCLVLLKTHQCATLYHSHIYIEKKGRNFTPILLVISC